MKNLTAKQLIKKVFEQIYGSPRYNKSILRGTYEKVVIKAMQEYAEIKVKKENTRLHDRFIEAMPVGYFDSTDEFLKMRDLIFNENYNLR